MKELKPRPNLLYQVKKSDDHAKSLLTSITNLHLRNIFSNGVESNIQ